MIKLDETKKSHSSYWLGDFWSENKVSQALGVNERKNHDLFKLAATKRAIANFVQITTRKSVPVQFNSLGKSYTDGKAVVLSTTFESPQDFDVAAGLALHEGMHIVHSDFDYVKDIGDNTPTYLINKAVAKGVDQWMKVVKDCLNVVEDRRIDYLNYKASPGYQSYYDAMYDKYFRSPVIDLGLQSNNKRTETIDSYMYRLINIHNKNTDLSALNGLNDIMRAIDFKNIDRLKSTQDAWEVALEVFEIIINNVDAAAEAQQKEEKQKRKEEKEKQEQEQPEQEQDQGDSDDEDTESGESGDKEENDEGGEAGDDEEWSADGEGGGIESEEETDETEDDGSEAESGDDTDDVENEEETDGNDGEPKTLTDEEFDEMCENLGKGNDDDSDDAETETYQLTPEQEEKLNEAIEAQEDFMNGDIEKEELDSNEEEEMKDIEESGIEIKSVAHDLSSYNKGIDVVVVKKLTQHLIDSSIFPMKSYYGNKGTPYLEEVNRGFILGKRLGKKLQVRSEQRTTIFNRQKSGKIDKRMIASLGFGNENVFEFREVNQYNTANLHVSIDASSSMGGQKWKNTMVNVTALCVAVSIIPNLDIQVSFRTTTDADKGYIVLAYNSKTDKLSKIKKLFPQLVPNGLTPEGLCFEAVMDEFLPAGNHFDSYFLNISDGEPYFQGGGIYYSGEAAFQHTKKMVKKIESYGIKTLSYFVGSRGNECSAGFKKMYGAGATYIDVTSVGEITKTINKMFLTKK